LAAKKSGLWTDIEICDWYISSRVGSIQFNYNDAISVQLQWRLQICQLHYNQGCGSG